MPMPTAPLEKLSEPEREVARNIAQTIGGIATAPGVEHPLYSTADLTRRYAEEPKNALAVARESLLSIGSDRTLTPTEKSRKLDGQLDAVFGLTIKLDHAAFPDSKKGEVHKGTPDYIPDGFIDMGKESTLVTAVREREQLVVDKRAVLEMYRPFLKEVLSRNYSGVDLQAKKRDMVESAAAEVYRNMQYDAKKVDMGGGVVKLSEMSEGVCRHQAMAF